MGRTSKVVVCGMKGVGKTAILQQVIYGNVNLKSEFYPTIEDIFVANIETDKNTKEKVRFYDTAGLEQCQTTNSSGTINQQLPRHYLTLADGYILVYDTEKAISLDALVSLKRDIDRNKDKKEVVIIVIANKTKDAEITEFESTISKGSAWCSREKLRHFAVNAMDRNSLYEPFIFLTSKLVQPTNKSTFTPLSMTRKVLKDSVSGLS